MAFDFGGYTLSLKPARTAVQLIPGWGVHRLRLIFEAGATGMLLPPRALQLSGELWANDLGHAGWLGSMVSQWPLQADSQGRDVTLDVTLTDAQIMGLEKARKGRELELRADLTVVQLGAVDGWPAREHQLTIRISHEEWAKALAGLNAGAFVDVLVPITDVEDRALAARRLREAKALIGSGDFEGAVGKARSALDPVRAACNTEALHSQAVNKKAKERTQEERWAMLIQNAYALFSGAPHDDEGTTEHFAWTRADAVAAVATAAGLLTRLEDLP
ncbi:hypothetical protein [Actinacidiphila soli]|uniref:hypothetical protein n=1 Tax=Actinacidiphila soli TaxID=2487275 RepID=UPI000FCB3E62|nr:hypothetical protein [Actinacidiphila soli]